MAEITAKSTPPTRTTPAQQGSGSSPGTPVGASEGDLIHTPEGTFTPEEYAQLPPEMQTEVPPPKPEPKPVPAPTPTLEPKQAPAPRPRPVATPEP